MLSEIDRLARKLGVYIVCNREGSDYVAITLMDVEDSRVIVGVSGKKASSELAIIEAWGRSEPFYQKLKDRDPATLAEMIDA